MASRGQRALPSTVITESPVRDLAPAFMLGVIALLAQALIAREALSAAAGHPLVFGVVLGGWLAVQAACLFITWRAGSRVPVHLALPIAAFTAPLSLTLMRLLTAATVPLDGTLPHLGSTITAAAAACLPVSGGVALCFSAVYHRATERYGTAALWRVYAAETAGFLTAGTAWTFLLAGRVTHLGLTLMLPGAAFAVLACTGRFRLATAAAAVAAAVAAFFAAPILDQHLAPGLPEGLTPVAALDGRQARWQVAGYAGDYSFYRNGRLVSATGQPECAAQAVLLPLAQAIPPAAGSPGPATLNVLHIGLRDPGAQAALSAVEGTAVTWLDGDRDYVQLLQAYGGGPAAPVTVNAPSPALATRAGGDGWDLVLLNAGPPTSPEAAWAYSPEFLRRVRDGLAPTGVVALSLEAEANYNASTLRRVHAQLLGALTETFATVLTTPPSPVCYLAGNPGAQLTLDPVEIESRLAARGYTGMALNRYILTDRLDPGRSAGWQDPSFIPSEDSAPLALNGLRMDQSAEDPVLCAFLNWLQANRRWLGAVVAAMLLAPALWFSLRRRRGTSAEPVALAWYAGFTCLAAEIALAWLLQALIGQLYWLLGLLTAIVLGGLFAGNLLAGWRSLTPRIAAVSLAALVSCVALLAHYGSFDPVSLSALWLLAALVPTACGLVLGQVLRTPHANPLHLYAADLAGAALAALLVGTVGLLAWGILWSTTPLAVLWLLLAVGIPVTAGYNASSSSLETMPCVKTAVDS